MRRLLRPCAILLQRFARREDGSPVVEFALGAPLVLMLMLGIMEVGRLIYAQAALNFAAEEATRYAIVREGQLTDQQIENYAAQQLIGVDQSLAVFTATSPIDSQTGTSLITIQVSYPFQLMIPFFSSEPITLSAESRGFLAFPAPLPPVSG